MLNPTARHWPPLRAAHKAGHVASWLLAGAVLSASAATKSWDGGAGTVNWADAANWNANGTPNSSDAVLLDNSSVNPLPQINAQSGASCATLTVNGAVAGTFLNYGGATPLVLNLYGASVGASNTGPLLSLTTNAPAVLSANKIEFRLRTNGSLFISESNTFTLSNCYLTESGGSYALTKTGGGTLKFSGSGPKLTFSGGLNLAEGTLIASDTTSCLPTSGTINFINVPGTPAVLQSANSHVIGGLAGGNADSLIQVSGAGGLTINGSADTVFGGVLDDNGGSVAKLTHAGTGSLTLDGANTYTGPTVISSGRLALGTNGAIASTSIAVAGGAVFDVSAKGGEFALAGPARLSGNGSVRGGFTAGTGLTVAPGAGAGSAGTLTFSNGFTLGSGAHYAFDITNGVADQIIVTGGNVVLAGDLAGSQRAGTVALGSVFYLLRNTGRGTTSGTLAGAGDGGKIDIAGQRYRLSLTSEFGGAGFQTNGSGKDVAILAIYDPSPSLLTFAYVGSLTQSNIQVALSWQDNATNESGIKILRSAAGGPWVEVATLGPNATNFTDLSVSSTLDYSYRLIAFNAAGELGEPADIAVPHAWLTAAERRQRTLAALAAATPGSGDLKDEFPYQLARMLVNPTNSAAFANAQNRARELLEANTSDTDPFRIHSAMHGFLLASNLYTPAMVAETKRVVQLPNYDLTTGYVSENFYFMYNGAGFLACEQWPDFKDAGGKSGVSLKSGFRGQLLKYFDRVVRSNLWEHGSPVYLNCDLSPLRMVAEFAQDPEVKQKARATLDWLMLNLACDWNQGYYAEGAARSKGWGSLNSSPDSFGTTPGVGWMYYGGFRPVRFSGGEFYHVFWMAYPREYEVPGIFERVAGERFASFAHRSVMHSGSVNTDYLYAWHTPSYSLASMYEFWQDSTSGGKEQRPVVLKWLSDCPESTLTLGMENQMFFYTARGLNYTTYEPQRNAMAYGINPYLQNFQIRQTLIGVANVSPWYADEHANETNPAVIATLDPLYFAEFYAPLTQQGAIKKIAETNNWVFCHAGSMLFGLWTYSPHYWGPEVEGCRMLRSKARKNGWILETAAVSEYPGATNVDAQLDAFQADVLARGTIVASNLNAALPRLQYTSIHGYTLELTWRPHQSDNYWTVPPRFPDPKDWNTSVDYLYSSQARSNGVAINYSRTAWPLLENPWVSQGAGSSNLTVAIRGYRCTYKFPANSTNWGRPPFMSEVAPITAFPGRSTAVPFTIADTDSAAAALTNTVVTLNPELLPLSSLAVSGTGTNRTLIITPPLSAQSGTGGITFTATDPQGASYSQPITVVVVPAPQVVISNFCLVPTTSAGPGGFQFQVGGPGGASFTVEASTNLATWSELLTTNPPALPFTWSEPGAAGLPARFYRVRVRVP